MEQGLWTAIFTGGGPMAGGGIVYLADGKLVGGDSQFYWVGRYSFEEETRHLSAEATVMQFVAGAITIFGIQVPRYEIKLEGILSNNEASIAGSVPALPHLKLQVKLVKRMEGKL